MPKVLLAGKTCRSRKAFTTTVAEAELVALAAEKE
jgi:hypothetical protein